MTGKDWDTSDARMVAVFLNGDAIPEPDQRGARVVDDSFLLMFNAHHEEVDFTLPGSEYGERWEICLDTATPFHDDRPSVKAEEVIHVDARSMLVLRRVH